MILPNHSSKVDHSAGSLQVLHTIVAPFQLSCRWRSWHPSRSLQFFITPHLIDTPYPVMEARTVADLGSSNRFIKVFMSKDDCINVSIECDDDTRPSPIISSIDARFNGLACDPSSLLSSLIKLNHKTRRIEGHTRCTTR
jgi:hypothetical protein